MEAVLQSREEESGSPVMAGSDYTSAAVFISGFLLCARIYHPVWVLVTSSQRQFLTQHWAPIQARHDAPGLLSQLPLVASKSSHCCCFLLLLPPESLRIQGLERQCHVLIRKCFHSYRIYNLPACLYPYDSHLTYKLSRNYI